MKTIKITINIVILIISLLLICCNDNQSNNSKTSPFDEDSIVAKVIEIYDGDTFLAYYKSIKEKVRVLNIDCFETSYGSRLEEQAQKNKISVDSAYNLGLQAKMLADSLLKSNYVTLKRDLSQPNRDVYNRLLRYVIINGMKYDSIIIARKLNAK